MKKRPGLIASLILNFLSTKKKGDICTINEIKEKTDLHRMTVKEYLKLIMLIQNFAPEIEPIIDEDYETGKKTFKIRIRDYSPKIKKLTLSDRLILNLFIAKAFDRKSGVDPNLNRNFKSLIDNNKIPKKYVRTIGNKMYLTTMGKVRANRILSENYGIMIDILEEDANIEQFIKTDRNKEKDGEITSRSREAKTLKKNTL